MFRIGLGTDIHPFEKDRKLVLGGVTIDHPMGLSGHSDADVIFHALADALLGAVALGDLGKYFPGDEKNLNRSSREILHEVCLKVWDRGWTVVNVDMVVMAEEPKLAPYKEEMCKNIADILNVDISSVCVKATSCDKLGSLGRKEGIMAQAVVMLKKREEVEKDV